ncbi:MAG: terpene cyclase/mutase family protein [Bacteroidales bacterium]|nr:terpene cyclase/mutase family protein [Bacteroidales bacterium]
MPGKEIIEESLHRLIDYIESQNYRGYDPYDALKSPLFRLPLLRSNKLVRFGTQQLVKRSPVNLRAILGVPKGYNPVTLGLCIQGYSFLAQGAGLRAQGEEHLAQGSELRAQGEEYMEKIHFLVEELKNLTPPGYHGACWGYDFDWEARYASIPARQPTVVATGIIVNALYTAYKITGSPGCAELINSSAQFLLNDLRRTYAGDQFIFSYSPFDNQQVFNASMKGVRILAQAYDLTGDENLKEVAGKAAEFVSSHQNPDGSWGYSLASGGGWSDNYHSGYVLDCLHEYSHLCNDKRFDENIHKGYEFYKNHFIEEDGMPRFYADRSSPADCTAAAQTILTLCRFGDKEKAVKVARWMIKNMQSPKGSFYFRKYRYHTNKTSFMRWSDAWMVAALACLMTGSDVIAQGAGRRAQGFSTQSLDH